MKMGQKINSNPIPNPIKSNSYFFETEAEARLVLLREAKVLRDVARKAWRRYLNSYTPKKYVRTGRSFDSIQIGEIRRIGANEWGIDVYFKNDLAYHDSVLGKNQPKGHSIYLLSAGWKSEKLERKIGVKRNFTRHEPTGYLHEVSKLYKAKKHKGISLEIQWNRSR